LIVLADHEYTSRYGPVKELIAEKRFIPPVFLRSEDVFASSKNDGPGHIPAGY